MIHAVGPVWCGGSAREADLLAQCHARSIELAAERGCSSVAFPAISTGVYGYPIDHAAAVAIPAARAAMERHMTITDIRFVLFDDRGLAAFERTLG